MWNNTLAGNCLIKVLYSLVAALKYLLAEAILFSISDNSIIVYEKPAFIKKEDNTVIIYSDDLGQNEILKLENKNNNEIRKENKNNIDKLVTFEQIYKKTNDIYYWNSVSGAKEGK